MKWRKLLRGDVLIDDGRRSAANSVVLVLTAPTEVNSFFEYVIIPRGYRANEYLLNAGGDVEDDGWTLMERA
jgi:hypothetical protein